MKVIPIVSGGLDSVAMVHELVHQHTEIPIVVSFDYGQRHRRELDFAALCAARFDAEHRVIDLTEILAGMTSALTSDAVEVPDGHYAEESMKATIVPGRNLLMIAATAAVAVNEHADAVAVGVHGGDHFIYPDCRPNFIVGAAHALHHGYDLDLSAPFLDKDKTHIAARADQLAVPIGLTWSCYRGGVVHCGRCGTCWERVEALSLAGVVDPTEYEDREAVAKIRDTVAR